MSLMLTLGAFVLALGILIVVHELGHYAVACAFNVKILRFSVGFGRPLVTARLGRDRTEWVLALLPLGGYVKMLDERETEAAPGEAHRAFNRQSVWRRLAIVTAGPAANLFLAVGIYFFVYAIGVSDFTPMLDRPSIGTPASDAGIDRGDRILKIDGKSVSGWQQARWALLRRTIDSGYIQLEVTTSKGEVLVKVISLVDFDARGFEGDPLALLGLRLIRPEPLVGRIVSGSVADKSGMKPGDRILAAAGRSVESWEDFVLAVREHPSRLLSLQIMRGDVVLDMQVTPEEVDYRGQKIGRIGAESVRAITQMEERIALVRYQPVDAMKLAIEKTWETSIFSLKMIARMITGDVSWKNISGPVTIADYAGQSAQAGWTAYILFVAIISISLGVLNLLPIPLLDGGHLLYYFIEILKGSPVSERMMDFGQRIGFASLIALMAFAFYNDINRLLAG